MNVRSYLTTHPLSSRMRSYGLRFKIELTFKQAVRQIGAFGYHFWMRLHELVIDSK